MFFLDTKTYPEYPAPPFLVGELAWGTDGSEWVFAHSSISVAPGSVLIFNGLPAASSSLGWSIALITNTLARAGYGALLGVSGGATGSVTVGAPSGTQTHNYFWVQRAGNAQLVAAAGTIAINASVFSSTVSGQVTGSLGAATNAILNGIVFSAPTAAAGSSASAILNYPTVGVAE